MGYYVFRPLLTGNLTSYRHNTSRADLALPEDGWLKRSLRQPTPVPYHSLISYCGAASRRAARSTYGCWLRQLFCTFDFTQADTYYLLFHYTIPL